MNADPANAFHAWVDELAAADPRCRRFGARHHRYRLAAPLGDARVGALEDELGLGLPADYREYVAAIADGGVGPYHGLLPFDHPVQRRCAAGTFPLTAAIEGGPTAGCGAPGERDGGDPIHAGVIGLGHLGCGQLALLVVRGEAAGEVWLDAREAEAGVGPIAPSFGAYLEDWLERTAKNQLPRTIVPPGRCGLPVALSAFLARCEDARGLARGTIGGEPLRAALSALRPGAIAMAACRDGPFFASGEPLDPCPACEVLLENLRGQGLAANAVTPGVPPAPARGMWRQVRTSPDDVV